MPHAILQADLEHLNLGSLLQLAEAEFISGHIVIGHIGQIDLSGGQAVGASTTHGLKGREAISELFLENTGLARVKLNSEVVGPAIAPTISLVMEGCRLLDEWSEVAERRFELNHEAKPGADREAKALKVLASVLAQLEVDPTVSAAVRATNIPRIVAVGHLRTLISAGILRDAPPPLPNSAVVEDAQPLNPHIDSPELSQDPKELLTLGRQAFRDGHLQRAEELWALALSTLPNDRVLAQNLRLVRQRLSG